MVAVRDGPPLSRLRLPLWPVRWRQLVRTRSLRLRLRLWRRAVASVLGEMTAAPPDLRTLRPVIPLPPRISAAAAASPRRAASPVAVLAAPAAQPVHAQVAVALRVVRSAAGANLPANSTGKRAGRARAYAGPFCLAPHSTASSYWVQQLH